MDHQSILLEGELFGAARSLYSNLISIESKRIRAYTKSSAVALSEEMDRCATLLTNSDLFRSNMDGWWSSFRANGRIICERVCHFILSKNSSNSSSSLSSKISDDLPEITRIVLGSTHSSLLLSSLDHVRVLGNSGVHASSSSASSSLSQNDSRGSMMMFLQSVYTICLLSSKIAEKYASSPFPSCSSSSIQSLPIPLPPASSPSVPPQPRNPRAPDARGSRSRSHSLGPSQSSLQSKQSLLQQNAFDAMKKVELGSNGSLSARQLPPMPPIASIPSSEHQQKPKIMNRGSPEKQRSHINNNNNNNTNGLQFPIDPKHIGRLIGVGGATITKLSKDYHVRIVIDRDSNIVSIVSADSVIDGTKAAFTAIKDILSG